MPSCDSSSIVTSREICRIPRAN